MIVIFADKQDITRYAMARMWADVCTSSDQFVTSTVVTAMKESIMQANRQTGDVVVIMDYSMMNITEEELLLLHLRYPNTRFLLFSEQLNRDFLRRMLLGNRQFSVVLKDSPLCEIKDALCEMRQGKQYICTDAQRLIDTPESSEDRSPLTKTEKDILRLMAMGKKSKQIAEERFLSVYTVMTHRKNIFRKLNVNNAQEAVRYALRAGIVDPLEYYI